jgi:hypothetical protein
MARVGNSLACRDYRKIVHTKFIQRNFLSLGCSLDRSLGSSMDSLASSYSPVLAPFS